MLKPTSEKYKNCLNCNYEFNGADNYCPQCGQENHSLKIPLKHFLVELLEGTLHLETKILPTYFALLFKPGFLTKEFNEGRRVKYVHPIRFYIFISFVFFIAINLSTSDNDGEAGKERELIFTIGKLNSGKLSALNRRELDSVLEVEGRNSSGLAKYFIKQAARMSKGKNEFEHTLMKNISYMMFILMPFLGWLVFLLNRKTSRKFYIEYLIYSIHFHCFIFLFLTLYTLITMLTGTNIFLLLFVLIIVCIYIFFSLKIAFDQTNFKAAIKTLMLGLSYFTSVVVFLLMTVLISVLIF